MKTARIRNNKSKEKNEIIEEEYSVKKTIMIILSIVLVFAIFYFITTLVVKPKEKEKNKEIVEIDSSKITLSNILNRKENEYYVLAYKERDESSKVDYYGLYKNYIKNYTGEEALKFYYVDLNDVFNKNFISDEANITTNLSELKLNEDTLFKINNGEIEEYYIGHSDIIKILSNLKKN